MRLGRKPRGHFCWCCGRVRPNERFSGRGHARHVCQDCSKLSQDELAYRQAVRNIDQLLDWSGLVRRRQRKSFDSFLAHPNERVREYAIEVAANDARTREAHLQERLNWDAEESAAEAEPGLCAADGAGEDLAGDELVFDFSKKGERV